MALILWSKTLLKTVKDQVTVNDVDEDAILKRIRRKWSSMSANFQTCWHQAAKGLLETSNATEALRTPKDLRTEKCDTESVSAIPTCSSAEVVSRPQRSDQHRQKYHNKRDDKGRWTLKVEKVKISCDICNVEFPNEWKLKRHQTTKIHLEMVNNRNVASRHEVHDLNYENPRGKNYTNEYRTTDCIDEREILYESPCDIIMEDQTLTQ